MANIQINQNSIEIKEYNGERVVTFKDVDLVHGRKADTAKNRFRDNRKHFIEGEDYFKIPYSEFRAKYAPNLSGAGNPNNSIVLLTESGYLMLVKSFTDDLAWEVQRKLVKSYFRVKELMVKPKGMQVVDVPENPKILNAIQKIKDDLTAMNVLLDDCTKYLSEQTYVERRNSASEIVNILICDFNILYGMKPKLIHKAY